MSSTNGNGNGKMQSAVETVTPEQAAEWLEDNYDKNRPLRHSWVEQLASRMRAGNWKLTHQGIAFDGSGKLIDGQHRLWAIVEYGQPVQMQVSRGVDRDSFGVLDQHRVRSVSDLAGADWISPKLVASVRSMLRGPSQNTVGSVDDRDPSALIQAIQAHRETIERVQALLPTDRRARGRSNLTATVMGLFYRASTHVSLTKLKRFIDVYISGVSESQEEKAAILLRDWIMAGNLPDRSIVYQKAQRAVAAFMEGDPIKTLYAAPDDLYPLGAPRVLRKVAGKNRGEAKRAKKTSATKRKRKVAGA